MSRRIAVLFVFATALSALTCARTPPERQLIEDAAAALGGADRIAALKSIAVEGEGDAPNVGQNRLPDSELPNWKVTAVHAHDRPGERPHRHDAGARGAVPVCRRAGATSAPGTGRRRGGELPAHRRTGAGHRRAGERSPPRGAASPGGRRPGRAGRDHRAQEPPPGGRRRRDRHAAETWRRPAALRVEGHQAADPRGDARRASQSGRRRHHHGVQRLRRRERREDAEAAHHHHRQVSAVRPSRVAQRRRRGHGRAGGARGRRRALRCQRRPRPRWPSSRWRPASGGSPDPATTAASSSSSPTTSCCSRCRSTRRARSW